MSFVKLSITTGIAVLALSALVGVASARRLSLSSQTFRATYATIEYQNSFSTVRCPLTLEGSFHARTLVKAVNTLVGFITAADHGACATGGATVLRGTLPWHVRYTSFAGALPNITGVSFAVIGYSVTIREQVFNSLCLVESRAEEPVTLSFTREGLSTISRANLSGTLATAGAQCNGLPVTIIGPSSSITVLNSASRITLTLI